MDTLNKLGTCECEMCGEARECYDVGSAGYPEARCAVCYADGVGHGSQYGCIEAACDAVSGVLGVDIALDSPERAAVAAYYDGCDRDCCHY